MSVTSTLEIAVRIAGVLLVGLALAHAFLPKLLNWKEDIAKLRPINQHVFVAHAMFIVVGILLLGVICIGFPQLLVEKSQLALLATACFTMCWVSRLCFQFVVFRGDISGAPRLDVVMHMAGTMLWLFFAIVFGSLFWNQWQ
jgi:hypothetical protein